MKKSIFLLVILFFTSSLYAAELEVNKKEIQTAENDSAIVFENYGGPHAVIESADAISGIGRELGEKLRENLDESTVINPDGKYTLVHAVDFSDSALLNADILVFKENAGVDHIDNVRRILSGFLQEAYSYNKEDADVISLFITVYNAVYRNQLPFFQEKYKENVISNLHEQKAGLSTNWQDWAGKTEIVIPLNDVNGGISAVDTSSISDDKVIEALRKEDDKAIEKREKLAEIKENELKTASEKAKDSQKDAARQKTEGNKTASQESAKKSTQQQLLADKKSSEVKNEREKLASDKEASQKKAEVSVPEGITGLFVSDAKKNLYTLQTLSVSDGSVIKKSSIKQIRSSTLYDASSDSYIAVCGVNDGHSAVRLCLIDSQTLEIKKQGNEDLSENAQLLNVNGDFYTVMQSEKKYVIAVYDKNLVLKKAGSDGVSPSSAITMTSKGILVSGENEKPMLLNLSDLKKIW